MEEGSIQIIVAQFWLNLQNAYDIRVAEQRAGQEIAQPPTRPSCKATAAGGPFLAEGAPSRVA
jgi:hypothetical protein